MKEKNKNRSNKNISMLIALILVSITTLSAIALLVDIAKTGSNIGNKVASVEIADASTTRGILFSFGEAVTSGENDTVSQSVQAIVLPDDAPDKSVDWELYWAEDAPLKDEDIAGYLTLTPEYDGATSAIITCKRSFRDSIAYIKVTTRVGGFESICSVSYSGILSSIQLDAHGLSTGTGNDCFKYNVPINASSNIDINLCNVFGDVNEDYYDNLSYELVGIGKITVDNYTIGYSGSSWANNEKQIDMDTLKNSLVSVSIENRKLVITPIKNVENYYESITGTTRSTTYINKFKSYVNGSTGAPGVTPYLKVYVRCGNICAEFMFQIVSAVSGVQMSTSNITF